MTLDTNTLKKAAHEIEELVGGGLRKEDTRRLLLLVSRMQWQLGHLVSDLAEEVTRILHLLVLLLTDQLGRSAEILSGQQGTSKRRPVA